MSSQWRTSLVLLAILFYLPPETLRMRTELILGAHPVTRKPYGHIHGDGEKVYCGSVAERSKVSNSESNGCEFEPRARTSVLR